MRSGKITCPRSWSQLVAQPGFEPGSAWLPDLNLCVMLFKLFRPRQHLKWYVSKESQEVGESRTCSLRSNSCALFFFLLTHPAVLRPPMPHLLPHLRTPPGGEEPHSFSLQGGRELVASLRPASVTLANTTEQMLQLLSNGGSGWSLWLLGFT